MEARTTLTGMPMPVTRVAMEAASKAVIAASTEVSLIDTVVALRLNRFVRESLV